MFVLLLNLKWYNNMKKSYFKELNMIMMSWKDCRKGSGFCVLSSLWKSGSGGYAVLSKLWLSLQNSPYVYHETDAPSFLFALISFFTPLVGLVLYIIWRKDFPQKAKSCMNGMICGIIAEILVTIFLMSYLSQNIMGVIINIWLMHL